MMKRPAAAKKKRSASTIRWIRNILIGCFIGSLLPVIIFRFVPVPVTPLMIIRCAQQIFNDETVTVKKEWVPLEEISPNMACAVIASEDQNFTRHFGFDFKSIRKAYDKRNVRLRGASTITMQTAKNLFLWPDRSWIRKGLEAYFTVLLETLWSKERILEVYLNVAEMGKGIYGVEAAANAYFKKQAAGLTRNEAAMIAASLPRPLKMSPARPTAYMISRQAWILRQMRFVSETSLDLRCL
ncbi:MAG: monofunctional biosynthetic peptidoglycan transglycosylase [Thermodesulfobacteriota bacterium]